MRLSMWRMGMGIVTVLMTLSLLGSSREVRAEDSSKVREIYTYDSVKPYLNHALQNCKCFQISDAFDKRSCTRSCRGFKKKMVSWAKRNPVVHQRLDLQVEPYNFRRKSYKLSYFDSTMPDIRWRRVMNDHVFIGTNKCDRADGEITGMVGFKFSMNAQMKESAAKVSTMRGQSSVNAVAILKGRAAPIRWCCGRYGTYEFKMEKVSCSSLGMAYRVSEMIVGSETEDGVIGSKTADGDEAGVWRKGFKTRVRPLDFTLDVIGIESVPGRM